MVKKTLLSLAIAATAAGLAGCNLSSTDKYENDIDPTPVEAGQPGTTPARLAPVFSAGAGKVPLAIDLLFAAASTSDGTASTTPTNPATVAINKLDGFSNTSAIYLEFNGALNPDTVVAGQSVFLIKLRNGQDNAAIDALDINSILSNSPVVGGAPNPFSPSQPVPNADYEARYITLNGGATPAIQILPKKPLDPKTKYIVAVTNAIRGADGSVAGPSAEYELARGTGQLPAQTLQPVRTAIQGWEQLAGGFLANATSGAVTQSNVILSYAFTTGGTQDVLKAMAAPGTFLTSQITSIAVAEGAITQSIVAGAIEDAVDGLTDPTEIADATATATTIGQATAAGTLDFIAGQVASAIGQPTLTRDDVKANETASPIYYRELIKVIADGQGEGLDSEVDKPKSRDYAPIAGAALPYDTLLTAQITPKVSAAMEAQVRAGLPEGTSEEDAQAAVDAYLAANLSAAVQAQVNDLSSGGSIYQGGLQVPNYLPDAAAGVADSALGSWSANDDAAVALGLEQAPRDTNGTTNVTYRFPFAAKQGDAVIPVLATLPAADCDPDGAGPASGKPAAGWPVVIYQHGITVDRTAGLLIGNALASQCIAMVAIDHVMHGVAPLTSSGTANSLRLFNVEQIAASNDAQNSPFAAARAQILALNPDSLLADLKERHNNVGKAVAGGPNVNMVFQGALDGEGAPVTAASVGKSADLYINLQNFSRVRDGIRQTVLDMMNLGASIGDMDINGDGNADDLDPSKVYFIGHSLGGIVGTTFLAVNSDEQVRAYNPNLPDIKAAALGNPGGGIIKLLENSPTFSPAILGGLQAAAGLAQGSSSIESFFGVFQAMLDSADPINFAQNLTELPVLVYEDVGGVAAAEGEADDNALPDVVVPNNALEPAVDAAKSYLAGTDPLITQLGITTFINQGTAVDDQLLNGKPYYPALDNDVTVRAAVRMGKGTHSTFSSADPRDVFAETFQQVISFFDPYGATVLAGGAGNQKGLIVENKDVLEPAAE